MAISLSDLGLPSKFSSFHPGQEKAIDSILSSEKRFTLLIAPPGSGKSLINVVTIIKSKNLSSSSSSLSHRSLILTVTKGLQDQYKEFSSIGLGDITGHSNYPCASRYTDDSDSDFECFDPLDCGYRRDVGNCYNSSSVSTNYAHIVSINKSADPNRLGVFSQIICDEAHNIHDRLTDYLTVPISPAKIRLLLGIRTPASENISEWIEWIQEAIPAAREKYRELRGKQKNDKSKETSRKLSRVQKLGTELSRIENSIKANQTPWLAIRDKKKESFTINLTPVWCASFAEQYIFRGAQKIILSSATLSESDADLLGIKPSDRDVVEMQSTFPVKNRPFIFLPTVRVDGKMSDSDKDVLTMQFDRIVKSRLDRKGIGFTSSFEYALAIHKRSKWKDIFLLNKSSDTMKIVKQFRDSDPPSWLLSPSVDEGYDFKDDDARVGIITKVPFLSMHDPLVKARSASDKLYVAREAMRSILQMYGRLDRSPIDWAECFMLDAHWFWFKKQYEKLAPKYFRLAWRTEKTVPLPMKAPG